ncbi:hypothetical protein Droror1_Dr00021763 [Drosera rotundifolia]
MSNTSSAVRSQSTPPTPLLKLSPLPLSSLHQSILFHFPLFHFSLSIHQQTEFSSIYYSAQLPPPPSDFEFLIGYLCLRYFLSLIALDFLLLIALSAQVPR